MKWTEISSHFKFNYTTDLLPKPKQWFLCHLAMTMYEKTRTHHTPEQSGFLIMTITGWHSFPSRYQSVNPFKWELSENETMTLMRRLPKTKARIYFSLPWCLKFYGCTFQSLPKKWSTVNKYSILNRFFYDTAKIVILRVQARIIFLS